MLPQKTATQKKGLTSESLKKKAEELGNRRSGKWKPYIKEDIPEFGSIDGENRIRILRPLEIDELGYYGMDISYHNRVGINEDNYICLKRTLAQNCWICGKQNSKLWQENPEYAKTLFPIDRILMWVLNLKATAEEIAEKGEVLIWSCPQTLAKEILIQSRKAGTEVYIDISDPVDGRIIEFTKTGKGLGTKYIGVKVGDAPYPVQGDISIIPFKDCLVIPTFEEVKVADEGGEPPPPQKGDPGPASVEPISESKPVETQSAEQAILAEYECYGKQYGQYQDCEQHCPHNAECLALCQKPKLPLRPVQKTPAKDETVQDRSKIGDKLTKAIEARQTSSAKTSAPISRIKR